MPRIGLAPSKYNTSCISTFADVVVFHVTEHIRTASHAMIFRPASKFALVESFSLYRDRDRDAVVGVYISAPLNCTGGAAKSAILCVLSATA